MDVVYTLGTLGGVASKWQLNEHGVSDWDIGRARHDGRIIRIRRAWYALPDAQRAVCAAVRVGGMLTDTSAESGGESYVRLRLRSMQCDFTSQVSIPGVGRVDFLIGDRLVVEVDGYAVHGDRDAFERDRAQDLQLVARGYLVIRVSYRQILEEWPRIERAISSILRSRRHRLARQSA